LTSIKLLFLRDFVFEISFSAVEFIFVIKIKYNSESVYQHHFSSLDFYSKLSLAKTSIVKRWGLEGIYPLNNLISSLPDILKILLVIEK